MATLAEILSPSIIESAMQQGMSSPYAAMLQQMGYNWVEGGPVPDSQADPSGWFMPDTGYDDGGRYSNPYGDSLANLYQRYDSETGNWSYNNSYKQALADAGYLSTGNSEYGLGSQWTRATPETLGWFNQNYGTNFTDPMSYMNYLYGPGGQLINDPNHGQLYRPPEGRGINDYVNRPLSYDPPDSGMFKWAPAIIAGIAGAGLTGLLPGTTSIFGGATGAGAGAFGGDIAGTAAAGEGLGAAASSGFSLTDPTSWFSPDTPWGVNPIGGGDLPAGYFDDFVPGTFDGPGGSVVGDIAGITPSAGVPSGSTLSNILNWAKANPNLAGQLLGSGTNALSSYLASKAQGDAANQSNQTLWNMYQQNRADLAPWRAAGVGALGQLVDLTTPGKQLDTAMLDPGYAFRQQEGQNALDNAARAAGRFYSGRQLKDTAAYNQNFATGEFGNVYNRLAGLAGTGQAATNQTGAFGQNTAQSVANNQTSAGANRASGYMGVGNAITGGITGYLNNMNQQSIIDKLIASGAFR